MAHGTQHTVLRMTAEDYGAALASGVPSAGRWVRDTTVEGVLVGVTATLGTL